MFTDIINNLLFHGEHYVREDELEQGLEQGKILAYYEMNFSTGEIANKMQLTQQEVEAILKSIMDNHN